MIDATLPLARVVVGPDRPMRVGFLCRVVHRVRFGLRMHHLLFAAFVLVAAVPIGVLALWEERATFQSELDSVRERHLLVARSLTAAVSRYVRDLKAAFNLALDNGGIGTPLPGLADLLTSLNIMHLCVVTTDGVVETWLRGLAPASSGTLDPKLLLELRTVAIAANGMPTFSKVLRDAAGQPVLYMVKTLPDRRLGIAIVSTEYLVSLQRAIAFGDNGHAVITDARGQVIAHPLREWVAGSRDLSGTPMVASMMRGQTGVGQFYSAAFNGTMVAGYAAAPETGWGIMVAQPVAELRQRASQVTSLAMIVAVSTFIAAALMSWLIAFYLARPVRQVAQTAEAVLAGNEKVAPPNFANAIPREIRQLGLAFSTMLDDLRRRNSATGLALRQAESSSLAKSQFLANMSHEIRTPLNGVVGMIELLRLSDPSPAQQRYIEGATQSSQALLRLIDDILDLSKIEAGKLELEQAPFHLPSLVHDARSLFADQARAKGLTLSANVPTELNVVLLGDVHRLLQVLTNLLSNALKFTSEGGVTIGVTLLEDDGTSLHLRFAVRDTGIGIPVSKQDAIFDAFSQADSSTTRRYGGTGLGLSIARQLCHLMGGEIGVDSAVGKGSTFWFTVVLDIARATPELPVVAAPAPTPLPGPLPPEENSQAVSAAQRAFNEALGRTGLSTIRILLVEDNSANLRVTQALLEALGCIVATARDGLEAVAAYREGTFDLILMDCQMPEMDGYEATRAIRQLETFQGRTTPIVALTAHALDGSREQSLASGMNDHLTKPLTLAVLSSKLVEWLGAASRQGG